VSTNVLTATDGRDVIADNTPDGWEVERPGLWWTGGPGQNVFGNPIPGANGSSFGGIPAVDRATQLIVGTLATLPWHVYRNETERLTTPDWIADPQALRLDGRVVAPGETPENRLSNVDFWGQWILNALWWGDGFVYAPVRDVNGGPKPPMWLIHPFDVELRDGRYHVSDIELEQNSVIHLRGKWPIVDGRGTGVLHNFSQQLAMGVALWDYVAGAFSSGVPAGYLKSSQPSMTQEQADALKARWLSQHGGVRRSIAVLNATTEFTPLTWSPVDLAAVDFSKITVAQIALMFGVPAYLLNAPTGDSSTYANVESRFLEFKQLSLQQWIVSTEAVLTAQLPRATELRVEVDGMLRSDTKTRFDTYKIALDEGILTVDEIRHLEQRPPLETQEPDAVPLSAAVDTIGVLIRAGYTADSAAQAVAANDLSLLEHTGNLPVTVQPEGGP
jgi:HK97 family phage portal protein